MMRELLTVNPRSTKKKHKAKPAAKTNPRGKRSKAKKHHPRKNPRFLPSAGGITAQLAPAFLGGVGALATDVALANIPFPASIKSSIASGPLRIAARAALAVGVGFVASKVTSKANAAKITAGGLAVIAYDAIKGVVKQQFPKLALGDGWTPSDMSGWSDPDGLGVFQPAYPSLEHIDELDGLGVYDGSSEIQGLTPFQAPSIDPFF